MKASKKPPKQTDPKARLERAIKWWIEHDPVATIDEIKRVADKFQVHPRTLREAIRMLGEVEGKKNGRD